MNSLHKINKKAYSICALIFFSCIMYAQHTPFKPVSYRIFSPFIINPAITGTKDFTALDFASALQGADQSQILSGHGRIAKVVPGYFNYPQLKEYTNFGLGGLIYNDNIGASHSIGLGASVSYQIPVDKSYLSFLSIGLGLKGTFNRMDSIEDTGAPGKNTFIPNVDFGIYFYCPTFYAGVSSTNALGNTLDSAEISMYELPISRQYYFIGGYKFVLSRPLNIVVETSLIVNVSDSLSRKYSDLVEPMLKVYLDDFCFGAYVQNWENLSFFFQYKFPGLYVGALVDFPRSTAFYRQDLGFELSLGINFTNLRSKLFENWHW